MQVPINKVVVVVGGGGGGGCQVVALARYLMNGSIPFDRTTKQTRKTVPLAQNN